MRLILELVSGYNGKAVAIQCEAANGVTSGRSTTMTVHTPLNMVNSTGNITGLTGGDLSILLGEWS